MDIQFNTSRLYTKEGQIIRAVTQEDGSIIFHDFSRMGSGRIARPQREPDSDYQCASLVVTAYDLGLYDSYVHPDEEPKFERDRPIKRYVL